MRGVGDVGTVQVFWSPLENFIEYVLAGVPVSFGTRAIEKAPLLMFTGRLIPRMGMLPGAVMFGPWMVTVPLNSVPVTEL